MLRKSLLLTLIIGCACFMCAPKAEAVDPITIALLAPYAISAAKTAQPYVVRGLINGGKDFIAMGKDVLEIFYLPLGVLEITIGAPFGYFTPGCKNLVKGFIAPFKLAFHAAMLPVYLSGFASPY